MTHIFVVDDESAVLETLGSVLTNERYEVTLINSAEKAWAMLEKQKPDLMLLDIVMGEMDGVTLCRKLRRDPRFITLPILFLTSRNKVDDVVTGLDAGADDYVTKPFDLAELRARIGALLRRGKRDQTESAVLQLGDLKLDSNTFQACAGELIVQLTMTEHKLLRYLMEHPDQALSPSHLLQSVWEYPVNTGDPDLVRAHVRNLRAKLEKKNRRRYIRTIHGVGYMVSSMS